MILRIVPFLLIAIAFAAEVRYDCEGFVERGLSMDPLLAESRFTTEAKKNKIQEIRYFGWI